MPPHAVAHRCRAGGHPENSLAGLRAAGDAGASWVEFDVRRTADDVLVAWHDAHVGGQRVRDLTFRQLVRAAGEVALVSDMVAECRARCLSMNVDVKDPGCEARILRLLDGLAREQFIVTTLVDAVAREVKDRRPDARVGLSVPAGSRNAVRRALRCGADLLAVDHAWLDSPLPDAVRRISLAVWAWTCDDDRLLARVLRDDRLEGFMTNRFEAVAAR